LKKHISVKLLKRRIPLVCKVAFVADMVPVRVPGPEAIICIYHHNFAMLPEHGFQLCSVLLFPGPVTDESLYSHAIKMKLYSEMVLAQSPTPKHVSQQKALFSGRPIESVGTALFAQSPHSCAW
jgi:hypothetical protein